MPIVADHSSHIFSFPSEATRRAALLNEGPRTTFLTLKKGVSYYSSVDQVIHILERIRTRAIIKVERTENQLIEAIRNAKFLHERVSLYSCCSYFSIYVYCSYSGHPLSEDPGPPTQLWTQNAKWKNDNKVLRAGPLRTQLRRKILDANLF